MTRVKICGIRTLDEAMAAADAGAWAVGEVFAPSCRRIGLADAKKINRHLRGRVVKVGVFVDQPLAEVHEVVRTCRLDLVQLHGGEVPDYVRALGYPVIKAFRVGEDFELPACENWPVFAFLFDTCHPRLPGGSGQVFDWNLVEGFSGRFIMAGGLTITNVAEAVSRIKPFAVDVSSGVENGSGAKDTDKIKIFVHKVREVSENEEG